MSWYKTAKIVGKVAQGYEPETNPFPYSKLVNAIETAKEQVELFFLPSLEFCETFDIVYAKNLPGEDIAHYVTGSYERPSIIVDLHKLSDTMVKHQRVGQEEEVARDLIMHELSYALKESEQALVEPDKPEGKLIEFPSIIN